MDVKVLEECVQSNVGDLTFEVILTYYIYYSLF
jgi:hypothetical protein